jgi:hypothetical protein
MGPRCSSAETQVCHRSYIIAARSNSVLLWAVILVGLLITFFKLNKVIISESFVILCIEKVRVRVTCNHNVWINLKGHLDRML